MNYRRHIRIDASKAFYDTHSSPAGYLDGLLGITGELNLQKLESRDRYIMAANDISTSLDEMESEDVSEDPFIVNASGARVQPSEQDLMLEGILESGRGRMFYCFLYTDMLVMTRMVNNGEKYIIHAVTKFDNESTVLPEFNGNPKQFLIRGRRARERIFIAKSKQIATTWVSNLEAVCRMKRGEF